MLGMLGLFPDLVVEDPKEDLIRWANRSESYMKRNGEGLDPPEGVLDYPDLLSRGWGWKRLVTSVSSPEDMPTYKKYLEEYYIRNTAESVAQEWLNEQDANSASYGTGVETRFLATLVKLCIEAEEKFINKRKMYRSGPADEINLSEKILQGMRKIMSSEGEFPVAPAAVMEAELMCEWLEIGTFKPAHDWCISINIARKCALGFLEYKGPESSCVAGLMIGIAKETKTICQAMRENPRECRKGSSDAILLDGWEVLEELHGEIFSASQDGAMAEINTVGELTSKENDGKDSCKTKASADVISANPNTFLEVTTVNGFTDCIKKLEDPIIVKNQVGADVNSASSNTLLEVATVNGVTDRIRRQKAKKKKLEAGADRKIAKNQVENCGKTVLELKLDGDMAVGRKDYLAASMLYTQAIEVDPDDATLYSNSWRYINIGLESLEGYYRKGNALMSLKEYKEACDAFLAGLKLDPTNVDMERMLREAVEAMKKDHVAT